MKVNLGKFRDNDANRTAKVIIHDYDTWSLDYTLALIILPALLQLKQTKTGALSGALGEFILDVTGDPNANQRSFDFHTETYNDAVDKAIEEWGTVLDKMIWSFYQLIRDDYAKQYHHGKLDLSFEPIEMTNPVTGMSETMQQMIDKNPDGHWYDHVGHELHNERIQEGLELFGKYYKSLWD